MWTKKKGKRYVYVPAVPSCWDHSFNDSELIDTRERMITAQPTGPRLGTANRWGAWRRRKYDWPSENTGEFI